MTRLHAPLARRPVTGVADVEQLMELCASCERLKNLPGGIEVPQHLARASTLRKDGKVTFRYACEACGTLWDFCRGRGWHLDEPDPAPLLTRWVSAARARIGRPGS